MKHIYFYSLLFFAFLLNAQPTEILDIRTGSGGSSPQRLTVYNGNLYFSADAGSEGVVNSGGTDIGRELFVTDGTAAGTSSVIDIRPGSSSSSPAFFFEFNGTLYFTANDGSGSGTRIYESNGTAAGTTNLNNGFSNLNPKIINSKVYMIATTLGNSFYEFDGTNFQAVPDVTPTNTVKVIGGHYIALDTNTILLYMDYGPDEDTIGRELYKYDISAQTYTLVKDIDTGTGDASISNFTELNGLVYFEVESGELWVSDGTEAGTVAVSAASGISSVNNVFAWNNKLYFEGDNGTDDDQLYIYDPTLDTVTNLSNISGKNHDPEDYVVYNGYLYYSGEDANDTDRHLFRTDGTSIFQLDDTIKDVDDIVVFNNMLYFEGDNDTNGNELYAFNPATLNINTFNAVENVNVYPNPSTDSINILGDGNQNYNYTIVDLNGRVFLNGNTDKTIHHNLASGIYILSLTNNQNTKNIKFIVK